MLKTPTIVLNVKTYAEATGKKALELAMLMDTVAQETSSSMAIAVKVFVIDPMRNRVRSDTGDLSSRSATPACRTTAGCPCSTRTTAKAGTPPFRRAVSRRLTSSATGSAAAGVRMASATMQAAACRSGIMEFRIRGACIHRAQAAGEPQHPGQSWGGICGPEAGGPVPPSMG